MSAQSELPLREERIRSGQQINNFQIRSDQYFLADRTSGVIFV